MTEISSLTDQQMVVLQAIYDHFREYAAWPKFISIDRPIRRARKWDTAAIVQSLPESVIVPPRQGLRPVRDDELRLRLLGIEACKGGPEDTARFVRLLRWLAEREETYEPPAGSDEDMPLVTSREAVQYLGLAADGDQLPLQRLLSLLRLDHWSVSTSGNGNGNGNGNGWSIRPGEDIWRFRDVQTVQDVVAAREAWIAEGRRVVPETSDDDSAGYYHVRLSVTGRSATEYVRFDLSAEALESQILDPYRQGGEIVSNGSTFRSANIDEIRIVRTNRVVEDIRSGPQSLIGRINDSRYSAWELVLVYGTDVTNEFVTEPSGHQVTDTTNSATGLSVPPVPLYIDQQVIGAIHAKDGQSQFNVAKLLALIDELNDNYARSNTYASHALLRGILDHIPPILGQQHFDAIVSNYRWTKTDKKYVQQLAAFRAQGDDALHRQISADADLLGFDDMPRSVCVDRLLLECAKKL